MLKIVHEMYKIPKKWDLKAMYGNRSGDLADKSKTPIDLFNDSFGEYCDIERDMGLFPKIIFTRARVRSVLGLQLDFCESYDCDSLYSSSERFLKDLTVDLSYCEDTSDVEEIRDFIKKTGLKRDIK